MSIVVIADGILAIEGDVKSGTAAQLYADYKVDRDLAEDSLVEEAVALKKRLQQPLVLVTMAPASFEKDMRVYMATGCDRAIRIEADYGACLDPGLKATATCEILRSLVPDWRVLMTIDRTPGGASGVLHHYLAQALGAPGFSAVASLNADAEGFEVVTRANGVIRKYWTPQRVVLGVVSRAALRSPSFMDVHRARKAPIEVVAAAAADSVAVARYGAAGAPPHSEGGATQVYKLTVDETAERLAALCRQL